MNREEAEKIVDSRKSLNPAVSSFWRERNIEKLMRFDPTRDSYENCKNMGFSSVSCFSVFARNFKLSYKKTRLDREEKERLINLWESSLSLKENSTNLGISYTQALTLAREYSLGYVRHKDARLLRLVKIEVISFLRQKGFTLQDIGRLYRVSRQRIEQLLEKNSGASSLGDLS